MGPASAANRSSLRDPRADEATAQRPVATDVTAGSTSAGAQFRAGVDATAPEEKCEHDDRPVKQCTCEHPCCKWARDNGGVCGKHYRGDGLKCSSCSKGHSDDVLKRVRAQNSKCQQTRRAGERAAAAAAAAANDATDSTSSMPRQSASRQHRQPRDHTQGLHHGHMCGALGVRGAARGHIHVARSSPAVKMFIGGWATAAHGHLSPSASAAPQPPPYKPPFPLSHWEISVYPPLHCPLPAHIMTGQVFAAAYRGIQDPYAEAIAPGPVASGITASTTGSGGPSWVGVDATTRLLPSQNHSSRPQHVDYSPPSELPAPARTAGEDPHWPSQLPEEPQVSSRSTCEPSDEHVEGDAAFHVGRSIASDLAAGSMGSDGRSWVGVDDTASLPPSAVYSCRPQPVDRSPTSELPAPARCTGEDPQWPSQLPEEPQMSTRSSRESVEKPIQGAAASDSPAGGLDSARWNNFTASNLEELIIGLRANGIGVRRSETGGFDLAADAPSMVENAVESVEGRSATNGTHTRKCNGATTALEGALEDSHQLGGFGWGKDGDRVVDNAVGVQVTSAYRTIEGGVRAPIGKAPQSQLDQWRVRGPDKGPLPLGISLPSAVRSEGACALPFVFWTSLDVVSRESCRGRVQLNGMGGDGSAKHAMQVALGWARLHERGLTRAPSPFKLVETFRSTQHGVRDVTIDFTNWDKGLGGCSAGVLMALSMLAEMTDCSFDSRTAVTGELTLSGKVHKVGDIDLKTRKRDIWWADRVLIPQENAAEVEELRKCEGVYEVMRTRPVKDMNEVLREMVLLKQNGMLLKAYRKAQGPISVPEPTHDLAVVPVLNLSERCELFDVEVAVYPGADTTFFSGNFPYSATLDQGLLRGQIWVRKYAKSIMEFLGQPNMGLGDVKMLVDFASGSYTLDHPCATELMVDGSIPPGSLTIHKNVTRAAVRKELEVVGWATALGFVSVMTGLKIDPRRLVVFGAPLAFGGWLDPGPPLTLPETDDDVPPAPDAVEDEGPPPHVDPRLIKLFISRAIEEGFRIVAMHKDVYEIADSHNLLNVDSYTHGAHVTFKIVQNMYDVLRLSLGPEEVDQAVVPSRKKGRQCSGDSSSARTCRGGRARKKGRNSSRAMLACAVLCSLI